MEKWYVELSTGEEAEVFTVVSPVGNSSRLEPSWLLRADEIPQENPTPPKLSGKPIKSH